MEILDKHLEDTSKVDKVVERSVDFLKKEIQSFRDLESFLKDSGNFLVIRRSCVEFVRREFKDLNKWETRKAVSEIFKKLDFKIDQQNLDKLVFLFFTDAVCETSPTPSPLVFDYNGNIFVKRHSIAIDFDLVPFLMESIENLNSVKKHQAVFKIYPEDQLVTKGISKHVSDLNFLILDLLEKVLYEEVIPFDTVVIHKGKELKPDLDILKLGIESVFSGITEYFLGEKEILKTGILNKKQSSIFVKVKNYVIDQLKDKDELEYLLFTSDADEESTEGRIFTVLDYTNQKNVFEESLKREDATVNDRIESIFWLLGIDNINITLLVMYFDTDDIVYYILELLRQAQDEGFLTERFKRSVKSFLENLFQYPYISKGFMNQKTLDKAMRILFEDDKKLMADYSYYTKRYDQFLEITKDIQDKDPYTQLRQLTARYLKGDISKEDYKNWLILIPSGEAHFLYNLFSDSLDSLPYDNEYRILVDIYKKGEFVEEGKDPSEEEKIYTMILRVLGVYPEEERLKKLLNLRYEA
ncbi:hypothetical protein PERMA_0262 [Persephonella marina EX-H1]|uniref:Uncharacterized protein n=2 Tax=Hydrogenothermaceae TaxID=224027 RepID=C0QTP2_PERMH|nr:hypothetical protein PERMA_0262 [Persephonella marina EX-H1]